MTAFAKNMSAFALGSIQGKVALPPKVFLAANALAKGHYLKAEAADFCSDPVEDILFPGWMKSRKSWLPITDLAQLGFAPNWDMRDELLATCGVESHVDYMHGLTFALVLHNDGLSFKQGKVSHTTEAGQWFIFDDRKLHRVRESKKSTTYLVWTVPLKKVKYGIN